MPSQFRKYLMGISILLTSTLATISWSNAASAVVDNDPDCDSVAIIRCGVFDTATLRNKASRGDVPTIYSRMGISQDELNGQFVNGIVWRDGRVTVDGKVVATNAMTADRGANGTRINGTNAAVHSTNQFATEGQTAFVKMKPDGTFDFAILKSCGNPVKATPKIATQSKAQYACTKLTVEQISRTKYRFTATAEATGGATIEQYEFGFGDGYGITVADNSYTYDYKKTGTFDTNVVVHVRANGEIKKVTGPQCEKSVTVAPVEAKTEACIYDGTIPMDSPKCVKTVYCPIGGKTYLPIDSPECVRTTEHVKPAVYVKPVAYCTIVGKENLLKDDPLCVSEKQVEYCTIKGKESLLATSPDCETEAFVPKVVASTGPETIIGGVAGSSFLGYGAYAFAQSRRFLISKHLGK